MKPMRSVNPSANKPERQPKAEHHGHVPDARPGVGPDPLVFEGVLVLEPLGLLDLPGHRHLDRLPLDDGSFPRLDLSQGNHAVGIPGQPVALGHGNRHQPVHLVLLQDAEHDRLVLGGIHGSIGVNGVAVERGRVVVPLDHLAGGVTVDDVAEQGHAHREPETELERRFSSVDLRHGRSSCYGFSRIRQGPGHREPSKQADKNWFFWGWWRSIGNSPGRVNGKNGRPVTVRSWVGAAQLFFSLTFFLA